MTFSSALGVAESLLVRGAGLQPLTQVMGSSVFKVGFQQLPWTTGVNRSGSGFGVLQGTLTRVSETYELDAQTAAYNDARDRAVDRLRSEARRAGADAVVGVTVRQTTRDAVSDLIEFVAIGTAVRSTRFALTEADGEPLLCNLSGQDVAKLVGHGFWPVGIVGGSTVAYVTSGQGQRQRSRGFATRMRNQELPDFSRGVSDARLLAMERVERQAHRLHAHGIVGVSLHRRQREVERDMGGSSFTDLIVEMHVLGTAIVELEHDAPPPTKYLALPLT